MQATQFLQGKGEDYIFLSHEKICGSKFLCSFSYVFPCTFEMIFFFCEMEKKNYFQFKKELPNALKILKK